MNTPFRLPDIGEGLVEGEVVRWLVAEGDRVDRDQPLVEVLTDKATVELPSPVAGTIARIAVAEGQLVPVGTVLVEIEATVTGNRPKAAPATRQLALRLGVDLSRVVGTGPGGRITNEDVERVSSPTAVPSGGEFVPLQGIARVMATTMTQAWTTIPHIHAFEAPDAAVLLAATTSLGLASAFPLIVAAAARALADHPLVNAEMAADGSSYRVRDRVSIGIATATSDGLLVPVLADADHLSVPDIASRLHELVGRARAGQATAEDLRGGTFTITNFGSLGGFQATPIIRPPDVAILGTGRIEPRPVVVEGTVVARPTLPLVLGADHRLLDGEAAIGFLRTIVALVLDPSPLL